MLIPKITGETRLLAVIGHPVDHSLSPVIHNSFAAGLSLNYAYMAFDVTSDRLKAFCEAALTLGMAGFNLTMPLKVDILPMLDGIDGAAELCGAVNTVVVRDGGLYGYNTDGAGFVLSLERAGLLPAAGERVLIPGAGGAAKAVAAALAGRGIEVRLATRRVSGLVQLPPGAEYCRWDDLAAEARECALLVNATPLGMHGNSEDFTDFSFLDALCPGAAVYDLIYAPRRTNLLKQAAARGLKTINGLPHLVYQAALAFSYFTGKMPEDGVAGAVLSEIEG